MPALARAGAVPQKPAAAKTNGILRVITRGSDDVKRRVDRLGAREKLRMGLPSVDDALELRVR